VGADFSKKQPTKTGKIKRETITRHVEHGQGNKTEGDQNTRLRTGEATLTMEVSERSPRDETAGTAGVKVMGEERRGKEEGQEKGTILIMPSPKEREGSKAPAF